MLNHKTSVHFVNTEGDGNKILVVPTFILLYWKKFIFTIGGVLTLLLVIVGIFIYQKIYEKKSYEISCFLKVSLKINKVKI